MSNVLNYNAIKTVVFIETCIKCDINLFQNFYVDFSDIMVNSLQRLQLGNPEIHFELFKKKFQEIALQEFFWKNNWRTK